MLISNTAMRLKKRNFIDFAVKVINLAKNFQFAGILFVLHMCLKAHKGNPIGESFSLNLTQYNEVCER